MSLMQLSIQVGKSPMLAALRTPNTVGGVDSPSLTCKPQPQLCLGHLTVATSASISLQLIYKLTTKDNLLLTQYQSLVIVWISTTAPD